MRRRLATLAAVSAFALALSASPALASPAVHQSSSFVNEVIVCSPNTYLISGTLNYVAQDGTTPSGRFNGASTYTLSGATAVDQNNNSFRMVGVEHFGATGIIGSDPSQMTWLFKFQIVGTGDSLNVVVRFDSDGNMVIHDMGTCSAG